MRKNGKKFLAVLLSAGMILSTATAAFAEGPAGETAVAETQAASAVDEVSESDADGEAVAAEAAGEAADTDSAESSSPAAVSDGRELSEAVPAADNAGEGQIAGESDDAAAADEAAPAEDEFAAIPEKEDETDDQPLMTAHGDDREWRESKYCDPAAVQIIIDSDKAYEIYRRSYNAAYDYNYGYDVKPDAFTDEVTVWDVLIGNIEDMYNELAEEEGDEVRPFKEWFDYTNDGSLKLKTVFGKDASHFKLAFNHAVLDPAQFPTTVLNETDGSGDDTITMWFDDAAPAYLYFREQPDVWSENGGAALKLLTGPKASSDAADQPAAGYTVVFERYELDDEGYYVPAGDEVSAVSDRDGWLYLMFGKEGLYRVKTVSKAGETHINYPAITVDVEEAGEIHRVTWHAVDGYFDDENKDSVHTRFVYDGSSLDEWTPEAVPNNEELIFSYWSTKENDPDGEEVVDPWETDVLSDMDLFAQYKKAVTLRFDANGGQFLVEEYDSEKDDWVTNKYPVKVQKIEDGNAYFSAQAWDETDPEYLEAPEGKVFAGWSLKKDAPNASDDVDGEDIPTGNVTLYARYGQPHTVTFDAGDGVFVHSYGDSEDTYKTVTQTVAEGTSVRGYEEPRGPEGKVFAFYSLLKDDPQETQRIEPDDYEVTGDVTFYAQYKKAYTVTFDANGSWWEYDDEEEKQTVRKHSVSEGSSVYEDENLVIPNGYDFFIGWSTTKTGTADYDTFESLSNGGVTKDLVFYARYGKRVTLTFDAGDGYINEWNDEKQAEEKLKKITVGSDECSLYAFTPDIDDHHRGFDYWSTDKAGKSPITDDRALKSLDKNTTLYAQYADCWYVTLDANGGKHFMNGINNDYQKIYPYKIKKNLPEKQRKIYPYYTPEYDGAKVFSHWSTVKNDPSGKYVVNWDRFVINSDMVIYAQYTDAVTITLDPNREGAYFIGWMEQMITGPWGIKFAKGRELELGIEYGDRDAFGTWPRLPYSDSRSDVFAYWSFDKAGKNRIDYSIWKPEKDVTVYAQYAKPVELIYMAGKVRMYSNDVPAGEKWNVWLWSNQKGEKINGKYLVGWSLTDGGEAVGDFVTIPTDASSLKLYAVLSDEEPDADYFSVNQALELMEGLDKTKYTDASWKALETAAAAVKKGLKQSKQEDVNNMAEALWSAIDGLVEKATPTPAAEVTRAFGDERYATSLAIAEELKSALGVTKFKNVVLATGKAFPDALAGGYLANRKEAPIILISSGKSSVIDYIKANLASGGTVYILGSESAIPSAWISGLKGFTTKRLGGANRYETNIKILQEAGVKAGADIMIATGKNFADALSASAVDKPILLVNGKEGKLGDEQKTYLKTLGKCNFFILGGEPAVSAGIEKELKTYGTVKRVEGADRYETSVKIAKEFFSNPSGVALAVGNNYPDGLCGGPLACRLNTPLLLVKSGKDAAAAAYASSNGLTTGVCFGGDNVLPTAVVKNVVGSKSSIEEHKYKK